MARIIQLAVQEIDAIRWELSEGSNQGAKHLCPQLCLIVITLCIIWVWVLISHCQVLSWDFNRNTNTSVLCCEIVKFKCSQCQLYTLVKPNQENVLFDEKTSYTD